MEPLRNVFFWRGKVKGEATRYGRDRFGKFTNFLQCTVATCFVLKCSQGLRFAFLLFMTTSAIHAAKQMTADVKRSPAER